VGSYLGSASLLHFPAVKGGLCNITGGETPELLVSALLALLFAVVVWRRRFRGGGTVGDAAHPWSVIAACAALPPPPLTLTRLPASMAHC
jgi:hypothetical protein